MRSIYLSLPTIYNLKKFFQKKFSRDARKYPGVCDLAKKREVLENSQVARGGGSERARGVLVN